MYDFPVYVSSGDRPRIPSSPSIPSCSTMPTNLKPEAQLPMEFIHTMSSIKFPNIENFPRLKMNSSLTIFPVGDLETLYA